MEKQRCHLNYYYHKALTSIFKFYFDYQFYLWCAQELHSYGEYLLNCWRETWYMSIIYCTCCTELRVLIITVFTVNVGVTHVAQTHPGTPRHCPRYTPCHTRVSHTRSPSECMSTYSCKEMVSQSPGTDYLQQVRSSRDHRVQLWRHGNLYDSSDLSLKQ